MYRRVELDAPNVGAKEKQYLNKAIDSNFISTTGPFALEFEKKFAKFVGAKKAVSTQSGTAAIHLALHELGIGKGDEVIVPALTFVATANPVLYTGAKPVFSDVDINTWNISPKEIQKKITKKTKAIIPVHLYGNPCDMSAIMAIARRHKLYVIEDATESLGAAYKGRQTGTIGNFGCFSFNGNKVITTGGGGMIVSRTNDRLEHIKFLANQAKDSKNSMHHPEMGFNYRMTNIEAALGLAQLERASQFIVAKRLINKIYKEKLSKFGCIRFQQEYDGAKSSWWLTSVIFDGKVYIGKLQKKLIGQGIITRRLFAPLTDFPMYKTKNKAQFKNSYQISKAGLSLPSSTLNSSDDIEYVCEVLTKLL